MSSLSGAQHARVESEPRGDAQALPIAARDRELFERARRGDRTAYGQIAVAYQDRLYNAVLRMVGDREEASELTQETFARGLMNLAGFRGEAQPYTWLFRIAMNLAISQLRKSQRHRVFSLDAPAGGSGGGYDGNGRGDGGGADQASALIDRVARDREPGPSQTAEARERDQQVLEALGRLDAEQRAILVMRDIEGFDYQQMAEVLGLPLGTLKSRLFRARLALREQLKAYFST